MNVKYMLFLYGLHFIFFVGVGNLKKSSGLNIVSPKRTAGDYRSVNKK